MSVFSVTDFVISSFYKREGGSKETLQRRLLRSILKKKAIVIFCDKVPIEICFCFFLFSFLFINPLVCLLNE